MKAFKRSLLRITLCASLVSELCAQIPSDIGTEPGLLPPKGTSAPTNFGGKTPAQDARIPALKDRRFSLAINELNLSDAAEIIRGQLPELNIVIPPSLNNAPIGPLKLRNVTLEGLVRAIPAATDGQIEAIYDGDSYLTFSGNAPAPDQQSVCRILSLRQYLEGKSEEEVKKAIEDLNQVVLMARDHLESTRHGLKMNPPKFSVHPSTKLLIVVGSPESVGIVEEVVNAVSAGSPAAGAAGFGGGIEPFSGVPGMSPQPRSPSYPRPTGNKQAPAQPVPGIPGLTSPSPQRF